MKVLFSGAWNPRFEALPEYLVEAFEKEGHQVLPFDHRAFRLPGRIRAAAPPLHRADRKLLNRRLLKEARRFSPDLLLVNQGSSLDPGTIARIRNETGAVTINWWSDYPGEFEEGLASAASGAWDRFYVSDTDAERRHQRAGITVTGWLPFACSPSIHSPAPRRTPLPDRSISVPRVLFVGSAYPERRDLLGTVADLDLGIWGPGWNRYAGDPVLRGNIRGGALRPVEWVRLFQQADLVVNISYGFGGPEEMYGAMANVRVFEIPACGACQLVDAKRDILRLFRPDRHLATFRTREEFRRQVVSLLEDSDRRRRIASAGQRAVFVEHTWEHRVRFLVREAESVRRDTGDASGGGA